MSESAFSGRVQERPKILHLNAISAWGYANTQPL